MLARLAGKAWVDETKKETASSPSVFLMAETARRYHGAQLNGSSFLEAELGSASRMAER
jgi:hypothetical protein